jgi:hypothetical protein
VKKVSEQTVEDRSRGDVKEKREKKGRVKTEKKRIW